MSILLGMNPAQACCWIYPRAAGASIGYIPRPANGNPRESSTTPGAGYRYRALRSPTTSRFESIECLVVPVLLVQPGDVRQEIEQNAPNAHFRMHSSKRNRLRALVRLRRHQGLHQQTEGTMLMPGRDSAPR